MKSFIVVGLGRFGTALAVELSKLGNEVLAIDARPERVQAVADHVTRSVTGDARDPEVLRALGARNFDCAVVALAENVGESALITMNLKDQGVPRVVSKANSAVHRKVLEKIGADLVVFPEQEMALRLAHNLANGDILNFIDLSDEYSMVERRLPATWIGKTIVELDIRAKYHITIMAVRRNGLMNIAPGGDFVFCEGDTMVVLGGNYDIRKLEQL